MSVIAENLEKIHARIASAAGRVGRDPSGVLLVAVSKKCPPECVRAAVEAGQATFGESRVQEAKAKVSHLSGSLHWHLIGHLQTNKARDAVELFEMIQSVDSVRLARELDRWAERAGRRMAVLLECNVSGEGSKFGFKPDEVGAVLPELNAMQRLEIRGLMTMAPFFKDPQQARPAFRALRELRERLQQQQGIPLPELSMGMTNDFEVAVEEGATVVRIGTAIFGESRGAVCERGEPDA
ncbi:MAG: YggS family pyridoxal phosphate-dependent enzyme [Verrucomicrobia bacterium]|nr:YggS family pyridoxal phosphate-dependent enzyme [Verrucomicrobiota bacterium]